MTKKGIELAFLSLHPAKGGGPPLVHCITAQRSDRLNPQFSEEIKNLWRSSFSLFSTLPPSQMLARRVDIPKIKLKERRKLAETLLCSGGLFEKGALTFAFADGQKQTHLFCAHNWAIEKYLKECQGIGYLPTGLTVPSQALANFALLICHLSTGDFLHLGDEEGLFVRLVDGDIELRRTFSLDSGSEEELSSQVRGAIEGSRSEVIWVTGLRALDNGLISYLQAAVGKSFKKPPIESPSTAQLYHTFALALGSALEASKPPRDQIDFRTGRFASRRLYWRGLFQEGLLTLHMAVLLSLGAFLGHALVDQKATRFAKRVEACARDLSEVQKQLGERLLQLSVETARLPHALSHERAGESIDKLEAGHREFKYDYQKARRC